MNAKRYAEAAEKFQVVVAADPNNDLGWYQLGVGAPEGRDAAIARSPPTSRYMDLVPNMPDPYYGLGLCLLKTGDKAGALASLKHSSRSRPPEVEGLGRSRRVGGRGADGAAAQARRGASADGAAVKPAPPSPGNAAYVEAQPLRDRGHIEEAIAKFKQAIAADPRHSAARTALGELLLKIRRDDEAIAVLRATVDKNPTYSLAWYDLAFALRARGQHAAAVDAYEHYIKLKPGDPDPYYGLGRSLQHLGRARRRAARVRDLPVAREAPERAALGRIGRGPAQDADGARSSAGRPSRRLQREVERERRAVPRLAVDGQRPAVRDRDLPPDVETQTQPTDAVRGRHAFEGLEDARLIGARDPQARVLDVEAQRGRSRRARTDGSACRRRT